MIMLFDTMLCLSFRIFTHETTLDKLLTAKLSRMIHSRIVHQLGRWTRRRRADTTVRKR